jgi:hypothetical protein
MKKITIDGVEYQLIPVTSWVRQENEGKTLEWGEPVHKGMSLEEAETWCKKQGGRLPTHGEVYTAYEQKVKGFEQILSSLTNYLVVTFDVYDTNCDYEALSLYVRCVRDVK